ncbi:MAG TPA: hypothetical protein VFV97_07135 [Rhodanobacteraceae bacterium]|nr:hypothetical protein [Rhodanobacteraceae bacterium]
MTASAPLLELLMRLGSELEFDVAREVTCAGGTVDVVWFDPKLPLAAVASDSVDIRELPVRPLVAFAANTAAAFEDGDLAATTACIEATSAPLRILVIARDGRQPTLAPTLQSIDTLKKQDADVALRGRLATQLRERTAVHGRTIAMLQSELVEWARKLREIHPRSYSAESLFNRTGRIID